MTATMEPETVEDLAMVLPTRAFAAAWLNVFLATGDNSDLPALYRTVLVEVYDGDRVRLVATDSHMLLRVDVTANAEEPVIPLDEVPVASLVVMDPDKRGHGLMKWAHKWCVRAEKDEGFPPSLRVAFHDAEATDQPALAPILARQAVTFTLDENETVTLDVFDGPYPDWRRIVTNAAPEATGRAIFGAELLGRLGKLVDRYTAEGVRFRFGGPLGLTLFEVPGEEPVQGALMPIRPAADPESDEP